MKMQPDPRLPIFGGRDYERSLYQRLYALFREIAQGFNGHDDALAALQGELDTWTEHAQWLGRPIGEPFALWTHIPGVAVPPTDQEGFRYIRLTASDSYNDGVLTGESVSGTAPLITATAVVNYAGSPIDGQTVPLINTERTILRPGDAGALQNDALQNVTGSLTTRAANTGTAGGISAVSGAFSPAPDAGSAASVSVGTPNQNMRVFDFDASLVARTATETRMRNRGATYFMRIL